MLSCHNTFRERQYADGLLEASCCWGACQHRPIPASDASWTVELTQVAKQLAGCVWVLTWLEADERVVLFVPLRDSQRHNTPPHKQTAPQPASQPQLQLEWSCDSAKQLAGWVFIKVGWRLARERERCCWLG
jgi:hypothetical protein